MKKTTKFLLRAIAFVLTLSMFLSIPMVQPALAEVAQDKTLSKQYLAEIKMFYGRDEKTARASCESEGYIFCPTDLNEGGSKIILKDEFQTPEEGKPIAMYMGYKTTEDPDEAITDITLLDMKYTHFEQLDYEKFLNDHVGDFRNEAAQIMVLAGELEEKLAAGSPNAQMTLDSLNMFYVDESKSHTAEDNLFGNYLLHSADITFFEKFIQRGNSKILGKIVNLLCNAASDYNADHTTWVDRAKESEVLSAYEHGTSATKNMYDSNCQDSAKKLSKAIKDFSKTYREAKKRLDTYGETLGYDELKGMNAENGMEKLESAGQDCRFPEYNEALATYAMLEKITYSKKGETKVNNADLLVEEEDAKGSSEAYTSTQTLAQYIMSLANDASLDDHLYTIYPIIHALTQPQRVALELGGLSAIVKGLYQADNYASERSKAVKEATQKLKAEGYKDGKIYIWAGIDRSLYNKKVVQTDATKESNAAGVQLQTAQDEKARKDSSDLSQALGIIDICTLGFGGFVTIVGAFIGSSLWYVGTQLIELAGWYLAAELVGYASTFYVLGTVLCALQIIGYISFVVGLAMLVYSIFQWTGLLDMPEKIDYSTIPDVVLDARQRVGGTYSVRYDSVTSNASEEVLLPVNEKNELNGGFTVIGVDSLSTEHAELTCYQGKYDRWMAMYYTKSSAAGDPIEIKPGQEPFVTSKDHHAPEGYQPLKLIVGGSAVNVNDIEVLDKETRTPLYVFFPGMATANETGTTKEDTGSYITKVHFSHASDKETAINRLKQKDFEYIDVNLTPYDGYTILGYQKGEAKGALTDIRIANNREEKISFGDASYSKMGSENTEFTSDGLALYATADKSAGSPIESLSIEYKRKEPGSGMEPVCLFSGGDAVDIGAKWKDNILNTGEDNAYEYLTDFAGSTSYVNSDNQYAYEHISQEDPDKGIYLYFKPKEQYKAKDKDGKPAQRYIAGFSYFLAGDNQTSDNRFGSNYEFMQHFAKSNGFELVEEGGAPLRVMTDKAGEMTMATMWRDVGGYPVDTYKFDQIHSLRGVSGKTKDGKYVAGSLVYADTDGGLTHDIGFIYQGSNNIFKRLTRNGEKMMYHTAMYFGVSYTYNPHRAITGVTGLTSLYSEASNTIKQTGLSTPAGTFQACNVSIQGCPIMSAGISASYFNPATMGMPLYTNYEARQKSDLSWMTKQETEILTRYLLTAGARAGVSPLKEGDIAFSTKKLADGMSGFVPLCDMRTPGDYEHPMNFALDTTNLGSKYLYLYLNKGAGGRVDESGKEVLLNNEYSKKKYVAAVVCGVGKNPDAAMKDLYARASEAWKGVASECSDVSSRPMVTEFDEILPVDLSSQTPWYTLHTNDVNINSLKNGVWVRGNEAAYYRWDGHASEREKSIDEYEKDLNCAYIGVIRTGDSTKAAYGVLKYYTDNGKTASSTLNCGGTVCNLAGGPVNSPEGKYYLYYSHNSGTANYQAPFTGINISDSIFVNGYNTSLCVSESDRMNNKLPKYGQLRMRTDEYKYIHLSYDRVDLPYYEMLYVGIGNTKEEAYADMIGTTNSYAAIDVNCNYNSYSDKWVAIGYRRTNAEEDAIRDIFLYYGDNPPDEVRIDDGYLVTESKVGRKTKLSFAEYSDEDGPGVPYYLLKHNLKDGADVVSLNEGNGGPGLYLYYTTAKFHAEKSVESQMAPITNLCFAYGDITPAKATAEDLASAFEHSFKGAKDIDLSAYQDPIWECVMGVEGSPQNWKLTTEGASRFSLNKGAIPGMNGNKWDGMDNRVYMYVDRANSNATTSYKVRDNAKLPSFGYYSRETTFGILKHEN